jgi:hypothetical protein
MRSSRPPTPSGFHALFSLVLGGLVPRWLHRHELVPLAMGLIIWVGLHVLIQLRAKPARGVFLDEERELFCWFGIACFLGGLLFVSSYYVVHG